MSSIPILHLLCTPNKRKYACLDDMFKAMFPGEFCILICPPKVLTAETADH